jgi:hypothetical protein
MPTSFRKLVFTAHVIFAVGWLGAVVAYLALAIASLESKDMQMVRSAFLSMELIGWNVIVPLSLATLFTGLVQSLGTEWGLFRHYWIAVKFVLTVFAVSVLLRHMSDVSHAARLAAEPTFSRADLREPFGLVLHPALGMLVLLTATVLSIYKPWGMTPYGRRKQQERREAPREVHTPVAAPLPAVVANDRSAWWAKVIAAHVVIVLVVLAIVGHVVGGGMRHH